MRQVGPEYWLGWAKAYLDGVRERRDGALEKIRTYLVWLWTGYTSAVGIGFTIAERTIDDDIKLWLAAGSVLLIVAYAATVHALIPPRMKFDPQHVPGIVAAHNEHSRVRRNRIGSAFLLSMVATGVAGVGLLFAATSEANPPNELRVAVQAPRDGALQIAVRGRVPPNSSGGLWLERPDGERILEQSFTTFADGVIGQHLDLPSHPDDLAAHRVVISWPEEGVEHRLSRPLGGSSD